MGSTAGQGSRKATPLVLVHALAQDGAAWALLDWPGALTPTLAGHGPGSAERRSLDEMADEVAAAAPAQFDVAAVAFGGLVAQHLLLRHPERVRSALLACTTATVTNREQMRRRAAEARAAGLDALAPKLLERWFTPRALERDHPGVRYTRRRLREMSTEGYALSLEAAADHETIAELEQVRIPVTLVVGLDDHVGRGTVEEMAEYLPCARIRAIAGPHMLHLEQPQAMKKQLEKHLAWAAGIDEKGREPWKEPA